MKVKFGDIVKDVKINIDRKSNHYRYYIAGDHLDSENLSISRRGDFATDDVGPAFTRLFKAGQILYGSRRTYLKKVAVADFDGICANTTFVFETNDPSIFDQRLLPFIMLSDDFTNFSINHSKGSTNPYILFSDLALYEFELPNLEEQKKLAKILWAAEETKQAYKNLLQKTDDMIKAKFEDMFENANCDRKPISFFVDLDINKIKSRFQKNDNIRYIDISSIDNSTKKITGYTNYAVKDAPSRAQQILIKDDILVSTVRPNLRNFAINPYNYDNVIGTTGFCVLRAEKCPVEYLWGIVNSDKFTRAMVELTNGANYPAVRDKDILNYHVPYVPNDEMVKYKDLYNQAEQSKQQLQKSLDSLNTMMKALINENLK